MMSISPDQIERFDRDGAVTIDTPFTAEQIAAAAAEVDRMFTGNDHNGAITAECVEPTLLDMATHPFMQDVSRQVLGAQRIYYRGNAVSRRYRQAKDGEFGLVGEHADGTFTWSEFIERPRRVGVSLLIWITDVTPDRSPLMYRPGSHRQLAQKFEQDPASKPEYINAKELPKQGIDFAEVEPVLARAGQVTVITLGTVHSASVCMGQEARKVMFNSYVAAEHYTPPRSQMNPEKAARRQRYMSTLRDVLPADRIHLLPPIEAESAVQA